jgi:hypothetical protein
VVGGLKEGETEMMNVLREIEALELERQALITEVRQLDQRTVGWELLARAGVSEVHDSTAVKLGLIRKNEGEIQWRNLKTA